MNKEEMYEILDDSEFEILDYELYKYPSLVPFLSGMVTDHYAPVMEEVERIVEEEIKKRTINMNELFDGNFIQIGDVVLDKEVVNTELERRLTNLDLKNACRRLRYEDVDKIRTLEAKLAESEKKREYLFSSNCDYVSQIEELKQQLAEKDKEIEEVRSNHANLVADIAYKA